MDPWGIFSPAINRYYTQSNSPVTSWWSPSIEVNFAGHKGIEDTVIRDVASYGKQLGIIMDVLLELTQNQKNSDTINRLKNLIEDVDKVKDRHLSENIYSLKEKLNKLKAEDPKALEHLLEEIKVS